MARWTPSNPHPTKVNLLVEDGVWVARHGTRSTTAPMRVQRGPRGLVDMGKFDALHLLCDEFPGLENHGYVVLDY